MKNFNLKPFVKWAGGKSQLLNKIREFYPHNTDNTITRYCEPFVGGGAVLFDILKSRNFDSIYISDANKELINSYMTVRDDADNLINVLSKLQNEFLRQSDGKSRGDISELLICN